MNFKVKSVYNKMCLFFQEIWLALSYWISDEENDEENESEDDYELEVVVHNATPMPSPNNSPSSISSFSSWDTTSLP